MVNDLDVGLDFTDRRSVPRAFANDLLCKITSQDNQDCHAHASIINIGSYGLMIAIKLKLSVSMPVIVQLSLPLPFGDVSLKGAVSWTAMDAGHFTCGIDFTDKEAEGLEKLKKYVASILKDTNIVERRRSRAPKTSKNFVERRAKRSR